MGCWNKTCGLTQLPIFDGQRVITFLVVESPYKESQCYENAFWNLIPLPIYGKYDDYGWMEEDKKQGWKLKLLEKIFGSRLVRDEPYKTDSGYVRYPAAKTTPFSSFKALGEAMHGQLFSIDWHPAQSKLKISAFMVSEDSFNEMSKEWYPEYSEDKAWPKEAFIKDYEDFSKEQQSLNKDSELMEKLMEQQKKGRELSEEEQNQIIKHLRHMIDGGMLREVTETFIKRRYPDEKYSWNIPTRGLLDMWFTNTHFSGEGFVTADFTRNSKDIPAKEAVDSYFIQHLFSALRKQYMPMGHEGSQAGITRTNKLFAEVYKNRIDDYYKEYGEDEEDAE